MLILNKTKSSVIDLVSESRHQCFTCFLLVIFQALYQGRFVQTVAGLIIRRKTKIQSCAARVNFNGEIPSPFRFCEKDSVTFANCPVRNGSWFMVHSSW